MLQKLKTNRLFYGKYPYKISCNFGTRREVTYNISRLRHEPQILPQILKRKHSLELKNILQKFQPIYQDKNSHIRIEHPCVNVFLQNKEEYDNVYNRLKEHVVSVTEPASDIELNVISDKKRILCDKLPRGKYQFKVCYKGNTPFDIKKNICTWVNKNQDKVFLTPGNLSFFKTINFSFHSQYIYVTDSKTLLMLSLISNAYISDVHEYIVRSSINTDNNRETLCPP